MSWTRGAIAVAMVLLLSSACTYHRAYLDYDEHGRDVRTNPRGWDGERLGVVRASEGGAIWEPCTRVAEGSLWVLMEETRRLGGNAIGDFRWVPQHPRNSSEMPMCRQRWGWFLIWPVLLTPAFQSAGVEAVAYRVADPAAAGAGLYLIPESEEERLSLAESIVAEAFTRGSF
jgi:hypothetical protein